jgi:hypothetical protein
MSYTKIIVEAGSEIRKKTPILRLEAREMHQKREQNMGK